MTGTTCAVVAIPQITQQEMDEAIQHWLMHFCLLYRLATVLRFGPDGPVPAVAAAEVNGAEITWLGALFDQVRDPL